ncbi:hypothetical protein ACJMK2_031350 [Sinanodonta woodiana]|uniref:HECT domain-containing protein n=1 Tax=Sinanodonta woodiana TaxID=1069815 RepID=A0ABD3WYI9_SINWO
MTAYHKPPVIFLNKKAKESNCEEAESIQITCPLDIAVPVHLQSKEEFSFESVLKVTPSESQPVAESIFESVETLSTPSHALQLASFANMYANCTQNAIMPSILLDSMLDQHSSDNEILFHSGDNHFNTTSELDDTVPLNESVKKVIVQRGHVFNDMMNYFLDANFDPRLNQLQVELVSERGENAGSVFRDVVSVFWETFYIKHTVGSDIKIPTTVHIMRREHWEAVAKVLICGYEQEGYLPIQLSQVFLQRCIDGKDVQDEQLLNTFLSSLPTMDKEIFEMALNDFHSVDEEDLCDAYSSYEARIMPTKDNIRKLVKDISRHQIVQKPSFVTECWSPLLQYYLRSLLPNTGLEEVYRDLHVTNKKVLNLLQLPDDISKAEKLTLDGLRQYIKSCNKYKLTVFLRFCTGSDLIIGKQIQVRLTPSMSAFTLRPIAHTCGCVLELSTSYENFLLREHFDNILDSKMLRMDII